MLVSFMSMLVHVLGNVVAQRPRMARYEELDLTMEKMEMKDIEGTAYTLIAYSRHSGVKLDLSYLADAEWQEETILLYTHLALSGEEVLLYYRQVPD